MNLGGGSGSTKKAPALKTVSIPSAESLALNRDTASYNASDADWAKRFPLLPVGRAALIQQAGQEDATGVTDRVDSTLRTAGLNTEADKVATAKDPRAMSRELGLPLLPLENRGRNFASTLLAENPERTFGLGGADVLNILEGNTGSNNAYAQAAYKTQLNAANANTLQEAQNFGALTNIIGGLATDYSKYRGSTYTDPYANFYNPATPYYPGLSTGAEDPAFTASAIGG